jgi:Protein of unknown function (DUF3618)
MARQSERLEREAEESRAELAYSLDELRQRLTPSEIAEEVIEYARETPVADFARNLARDVRASPLPLVVIFAGMAWAAIASALAQRRAATRVTTTTPTAAVEARPAEAAPAVGHQEWEVAPLNETVE